MNCAYCDKDRKLDYLGLCRWCADRLKWEVWHKGLTPVHVKE